MQQMFIAGRIGQDCKNAKTQNGDSVTNFSVAVDDRNKNTNWYRCALWGKRADALAPYLLKGVSVSVSGEFSLEEYDGKQQLNIRVGEVTLQGGRSQGNSGGTNAADNSNRQGQASAGYDDLDDSIPFATMNTNW